MTTSRPFTLLAAALFLVMALAHIYRLVSGFAVTAGSHMVPMAVSWVAVALTLVLAVMLYRESQR